MAKVTVVGAGFVGATVAQYVVDQDLADVVVIDVIEGMPQGKALDLLEAAPVLGHDRKLFGTNHYADTKNSDIVVITAGIARKPGMSREDLLKTNASIVQSVAKETIKVSPEAIFIIVTNPLDVMTHLAWKTTKLSASRVIGMAGVLDSARFQSFIAAELGISSEDIKCMVLGGHGDLMVPLPRFSSVNGVPITALLSEEKIDALAKRTRDGGAEIVALLKSGSAFYAPGAAVALMVEAILKDKHRLLPACVYAQGEYGLKDVYVGLPAVLGRQGVEKIIELKLAASEMEALRQSAASIKENVGVMNKLLIAALTVGLFLLFSVFLTPCLALDTSVAATAPGVEDFSLEPDTTEHRQQRKEIEALLASVEAQWNAHNLDGVMNYYGDDYINNDGLDKKAVTELTKEFWKTYPDAKSASKTKQIRIDGPFATVESRDIAVGTTAKEMHEIGTKGDLSSVSEGQLYIKKIGSSWKIIGDRIDYEKVRVAFGLARELQAEFSAPEQIKFGKQYTAKLEIHLPTGLTAVASITNQMLEYPQPPPQEVWRPLDSSVLERVISANANNRNELLMATIGITNGRRDTLMGIEFLTRRLNVIPIMDSHSQKTAEKPGAVTEAKVPAKTEP